MTGVGALQFVVAGVFTVACAVLLLGAKGLYALLILYLLTWGMKAWSQRRLGGVTGDVIGCVSELNEILCLLVMLALFH